MKNDDAYITLKEISETLGENYSTIRHYKRLFNVYLDARVFGRCVRYARHNVDLFRDILDLKEDGYSNDEIEKELQDKKIKRQRDNEVSEQVSEEVSEEVSEQVSEEVSRQASKQVSEEVSEQMSKEVSEQVSNQVSKEVLQKVHERVIAPLLQDLLADRQCLIGYLEKLTESINSSLVVLQENQQKIYQRIIAVNQKVVSMETALGVESGEDLIKEDFDPGDVDIILDVGHLPEFSMIGAYPDMEEESVEPLVVDESLQPVIESIENSKPDKTAVLDWLVAEKEEKGDR